MKIRAHHIQGQTFEIGEASSDVLVELQHIHLDIIRENQVDGVDWDAVGGLGSQECHGEVVHLLEAEILEMPPHLFGILL